MSKSGGISCGRGQILINRGVDLLVGKFCAALESKEAGEFLIYKTLTKRCWGSGSGNSLLTWIGEGRRWSSLIMAAGAGICLLALGRGFHFFVEV